MQELYGKRSGRFVRLFVSIWESSFARLSEDWLYLALLGIIMAVLSYIMDKGISMCTNGEFWWLKQLEIEFSFRFLERTFQKNQNVQKIKICKKWKFAKKKIVFEFNPAKFSVCSQNLVIQRSNITAAHTILRLGNVASVFNFILSRFRAPDCPTEYWFRNSGDENNIARRNAERIFDIQNTCCQSDWSDGNAWQWNAVRQRSM